MPLHEMIIVDDENEVREALCHYFPWNEIGFDVVAQFDNGRQALDYIKSRPPEVVLCDIRMPVMSGIDLAKELFELQLPSKVIFLSGYADFEFAKQALVYGVKDYILKPANYTEFTRVFTRIKKELESVPAPPPEAPANAVKEQKEYNFDETVIATVKKYVETSYWKANLKEASALVNMNPSYLSNFFKLKTDQNFSDYLLSVRMQNASEQLKDIHKKIYEVSDSVGYSNPKNFTRTFKSYFGLTPMKFRKGTDDDGIDEE